ncbi:MAG TPA: hypothetical protein VLJ37_07940 [bacterium]|nr:hypothetical protein [bacterium]
MRSLLVLLALLTSPLSALADQALPPVPIDVLVLGSGPTYADILKKAKEISQKSGTPFSDLDKVYDRKGRTFTLPQEEGDPVFPYLGRPTAACEPECISVEKSDAFPGMTKDLFLVVGGVFETTAGGKVKSKEQLKRFTPLVPDAYLKRTTWDPNCPL